jgi:hypothetical protein
VAEVAEVANQVLPVVLLADLLVAAAVLALLEQVEHYLVLLTELQH